MTFRLPLLGACLLFTTTIVTLSCSDSSCEDNGTCAGASSSSSSGGPEGGATDDGGQVVGDFEVTATAPASMLVGTSVDVEVKVARGAAARAITGPVEIAFETQQDLAAPSLTIPADAESVKIALSALPTRKHGDTPLVFKATAGDKHGEGRATTLIRGKPGSLDTSFGQDGTFTLAESVEASGIVMQDDGKIVVGGRAGTKLAIFRLSEIGVIDPTFNQGQTTITPPGGDVTMTADLVRDSKGSVALLFASTVASIIKLTSEGTLDPSFGGTGVVTVDIQQPSALAMTPAGIMYVGGRNTNGNAGQYVRKVLTTGAIDATWGGNKGYFFSATPGACVGSPPANCRTTMLALEPGGSILAGQNRNDGCYVDRITPDGLKGNLYGFTSLIIDVCASLAPATVQDYAFVGGSNGWVLRLSASEIQTPGAWGTEGVGFQLFKSSSLKLARRIANVDDKLVIAFEQDFNGSVIGLGRLTSLGTVDETFANFGFTSFNVGGKATTPVSMVVDRARNRVLVGGTNGSLVVARVWL